VLNIFNTDLGILKKKRLLIFLECSGAQDELYPFVLNDGDDEILI
jgi:hypothetical protein